VRGLCIKFSVKAYILNPLWFFTWQKFGHVHTCCASDKFPKVWDKGP
jgi:hypothetical protein